MAVEPVNLNVFQEIAKQAMPKTYYDYYVGGADDEYTLKQNTDAFHRILIRPRILVDVSKVSLSTTILGYNIPTPIFIAPSSQHKLAHPQGELATARGAASCNTIMVLSTSSSFTIEEVAASCDAVRFFQLYSREVTAAIVHRVESSGYKAIVLTADRPRLGRREADIKNKIVLPPLRNFLDSTQLGQDKLKDLRAFTSQNFDDSFKWEDIEWLKTVTKLPILIKGVLTGEDALKAVEVGVAGIIVSNHGARQLDYSPASISVLEEVVAAVKGKVPVLIDGGIRRGTDVFKALALGTQAVLIGRPVLYGLAVKGEQGVRQVLQMLKDELELAMVLAGCPSLKDITRSHVRTEQERPQSML